MQYEAQGYLPEAMVNFLARLGWAHGDDEVFTRDEFVAWFDLDAISPAPSRFDADKLQVGEPGAHEAPAGGRARAAARAVSRARRARSRGGSRRRARSRALLRDRVATLAEMADAAHYFYAAPHRAPEMVAEHVPAAIRAGAGGARTREFATLDWTREAIGAAMKAAAARHGLKPPQVMMAMRVLVCGTRETPAIDAVLALLGRDDDARRASRRGLGAC